MGRHKGRKTQGMEDVGFFDNENKKGWAVFISESDCEWIKIKVVRVGVRCKKANYNLSANGDRFSCSKDTQLLIERDQLDFLEKIVSVIRQSGYVIADNWLDNTKAKYEEIIESRMAKETANIEPMPA